MCSTLISSKSRLVGDGVRNIKKFADVLYGWFLRQRFQMTVMTMHAGDKDDAGTQHGRREGAEDL